MQNRVHYLIVSLVLLALLMGLGSPVWAAPDRQSTGSVIHIVQWGESLTSIARRYGISITDIVQANGITNPDYIYAGQRLVIPTGAAPPPPGPTGTYVVQRGDTLTGIARRFGTTVNAILALNRILDPNLIYVGQCLRIIGDGPPAPPSDGCIYVVQRGDTLTRIALAYHTTVWAFVIANNLANPSFIWVGQRLVVPACAPGPAPTATPTPTATATTAPSATPTSSATVPSATPTATATSVPPTPTNTPVQAAYDYHLVQGPTKDACHPGFCVPEVSGIVRDAQGNPLVNAEAVWIKLVSTVHGTLYCRTGDPALLLQPGMFKFVSPDGDVFRDYTLTVVRSSGNPTPLSPTHEFKMNSYATAGQQSNIVFQRNY
jgi:LysM repeat protein